MRLRCQCIYRVYCHLQEYLCQMYSLYIRTHCHLGQNTCFIREACHLSLNYSFLAAGVEYIMTMMCAWLWTNLAHGTIYGDEPKVHFKVGVCWILGWCKMSDFFSTRLAITMPLSPRTPPSSELIKIDKNDSLLAFYIVPELKFQHCSYSYM